MSYCIVSVIYGVPLSDEIQQVFTDLDWEIDEQEDAGFVELYTSGGPGAGYFGVELYEFDECRYSLAVDKIPFKPTKAQIAKVARTIKALPPALQKVLEPVGVYFVFHSS